MDSLFRLAIKGVVVYYLWVNRPDSVEEILNAPVDVAKGLGTTTELQNIRKMLIQHYTMEGNLPEESEFPDLVKKRFRSLLKSPEDDFWDSPYVYYRVSGGFEIRSRGPDNELETDDDLVIRWEEESL